MEQTFAESDPRHHTQKVQAWLSDLIDHLRQDVQKVDDPKAQALVETSAEVLTGLKTAFAHALQTVRSRLALTQKR